MLLNRPEGVRVQDGLGHASFQPAAGGFPRTALLDDFNRANEGPPPSANWSNITGVSDNIVVVSNEAGPEADGEGYALWTASTFGPDCEVWVTISTKGTEEHGLFIRTAQGGDITTLDAYFLDVNEIGGAANDDWTFYEVTNGSFAALGATVQQEVASGDSFGIEMISSTMLGYYKAGAGAWVEILNRTDATISAAGNIGILIELEPARFDNFGGGTI